MNARQAYTKGLNLGARIPAWTNVQGMADELGLYGPDFLRGVSDARKRKFMRTTSRVTDYSDLVKQDSSTPGSAYRGRKAAKSTAYLNTARMARPESVCA